MNAVEDETNGSSGTHCEIESKEDARKEIFKKALDCQNNKIMIDYHNYFSEIVLELGPTTPISVPILAVKLLVFHAF